MPLTEAQQRALAEFNQHVREMENQRIIEEQDRLWQEALDRERQRERDRRQAWVQAGRIDFSNIQAGDTFYIPAGEWLGTVTITGSGGFDSLKPRRRVVSPIFLGPAWVDQ